MKRAQLLIVLALASGTCVAHAPAQTVLPGVNATHPPLATKAFSTIKVWDSTTYWGQYFALMAEFKDQDGVPRKGKELYIKSIGGRSPDNWTQEVLTNGAGLAQFPFVNFSLDPKSERYWPPAGTHTVEFRFNGDAQAKPGSGRGVLTIKKPRTKIVAQVKVATDHRGNPVCLVTGQLVSLDTKVSVEREWVKISFPYDFLGTHKTVFIPPSQPSLLSGAFRAEFPSAQGEGGCNTYHYFVAIEFAGSEHYLPSSLTVHMP